MYRCEVSHPNLLIVNSLLLSLSLSSTNKHKHTHTISPLSFSQVSQPVIHTYRQADGQTKQKKDVQTDRRKTGRQTDGQTDIRQTGRHTDRHRLTDRQIDKNTYRQTDRHTIKQTGRQRDRKTNTQTKHTYTYIHTFRLTDKHTNIERQTGR
jgi:hypothetical protein